MPQPPTDETMYALSPDFYPVQIHEARYGVYEGGSWVLIAGLRNPRAESPAFGSDAPCLRFWERVRAYGPVVEVTVEEQRRDVYAVADPDPGSLVDEFVVFVEASDEYRTGSDELRLERRELQGPDG